MDEEMELTDEDIIGEDEALEEEDISLTEDEVSLPEESPVGLSLTVDDLPALANMQEGDEITLKISGISEDGQYNLTMGGDTQLPEEEMTEEGMGGGSAVDELSALL